MALSDLISRLEQEAHGRMDAIRRAADADVRAIETETEEAVEDITQRHLEHGRAERHGHHERELALARRRARTGELEALHAQIARILTRARELIPEAAASPSYLGVLPSHLDEALRFVAGVRARVRCRADVASLLQPAVARSGTAQLVVDEGVPHGVVVEAEDGSVVVEHTLAGRLARSETRLAIELARKLRESLAAAAATRDASR